MVALLVALLIVLRIGEAGGSWECSRSSCCCSTNIRWCGPTILVKLNAAFFTMNGVISVVFFVFVAGDLLLRR